MFKNISWLCLHVLCYWLEADGLHICRQKRKELITHYQPVWLASCNIREDNGPQSMKEGVNLLKGVPFPIVFCCIFKVISQRHWCFSYCLSFVCLLKASLRQADAVAVCWPVIWSSQWCCQLPWIIDSLSKDWPLKREGREWTPLGQLDLICVNFSPL